MNLQIASTRHALWIPVVTIPCLHHNQVRLWTSQNRVNLTKFTHKTTKRHALRCANTPPWEVKYAPENEETLPSQTGNIFESMSSSDNNPSEASLTKTEKNLVDMKTVPSMKLQYLKWPLWLLGPTILLLTGVVPTLWLPISSIFIGPNIATLLALTGLDCIFNLGASLFLLMADSNARSTQNNCKSEPPSTYKFWNILANTTGFVIPLAMFFISEKGFFQPQFPFISFMVLLGPYFLLLSVQLLTEMLMWHWKSPVWLVTPVVYEAYRLLQLMRGLKLGGELGAPLWVVDTVRGLVCGWVVVLGVQLMRVAWYAGFTARAYQQQSSSFAVDD